MGTFINKAYLINYGNKDKAIYNFKTIGLDVDVFESNDNNATGLCQEICSDEMIKQWNSHYKLWELIVKNNEDNVLILEDTAIPVGDLLEELMMISSQIPKDWDIIYLGCVGTCDKDSYTKKLISLTDSNKALKANNKILPNVIIPSFPLGLYGYMISYKGAMKLIKNKELSIARYYLDYYLAKYVLSDMKVYAIYPHLIMNKTDNVNHHNIIMGNKLSDFMNHPVIHYRDLGVDISLYSLILFVISFLVGKYTDNVFVQRYVMLLCLVQFLDIIYIGNNRTTKTILFETIIGICLLLLGARL